MRTPAELAPQLWECQIRGMTTIRVLSVQCVPCSNPNCQWANTLTAVCKENSRLAWILILKNRFAGATLKRLKMCKDDSQQDGVVLEITNINIKEFAPSGLFPATHP